MGHTELVGAIVHEACSKPAAHKYISDGLQTELQAKSTYFIWDNVLIGNISIISE